MRGTRTHRNSGVGACSCLPIPFYVSLPSLTIPPPPCPFCALRRAVDHIYPPKFPPASRCQRLVWFVLKQTQRCKSPASTQHRSAMAGDERHVDLIQLVDAQENACTELVEESLASMRELLQQPGACGVSVNTAARKQLSAQFEHLRAFLHEERNKLEQTLAGDNGERITLQDCTGARSLMERLGSDHEERKLVWWSRQFRSTYLEHAYRQHHIEAWRTRIRISSIVSTAIILFRTVNSVMDTSAAGGQIDKPQMCALPPTEHPRLRMSTPASAPASTQADVDAGVTACCGRIIFCVVLLDPYAHRENVRSAARPARPSTRPVPSRPFRPSSKVPAECRRLPGSPRPAPRPLSGRCRGQV